MVIGTVVLLTGVLSATLFTVFVVPVAYSLLSRRSRIPGQVARRLEREQAQRGFWDSFFEGDDFSSSYLNTGGAILPAIKVWAS
jgi:hypothetical protein